ncbi:hypothetical protein AB0O65_13740, partial [Microbacterium sp. NPDC077391]|uniref:hypothetical protein n=1 Tax=Microbacterium sp. NPDC077391 TaxID=3154765 RepID=UPI00341647E2
MTRDLFCILLAEGLQLVACRGVQVACGDLVRQRRLGNALTHRSELVDRAVDATARPVAERTAGTLVAILPRPVTVGTTLTLRAVTIRTTLTRLGTVTIRTTLTLRTVTIRTTLTLRTVTIRTTLTLRTVTIRTTLT